MCSRPAHAPPRLSLDKQRASLSECPIMNDIRSVYNTQNTAALELRDTESPSPLGLRVRRPQDIAVALVGDAEHAAPEHLAASSAEANVVCARTQRDRSEPDPACLCGHQGGGGRSTRARADQASALEHWPTPVISPPPTPPPPAIRSGSRLHHADHRAARSLPPPPAPELPPCPALCSGCRSHPPGCRPLPQL